MSTNEVKFKVSGDDLLNYYESVKRKGNELTNNFIDNARKESSSAKEAIKLLEEQIALLQKKSTLAGQISKLTAQGNLQQRISAAPNRDFIFDELQRKNDQLLKSGKIGEGEYAARQGRIDALINRNSPEAIKNEYREYLKRQTEQIREQQLTNKLVRENVESIKQGTREQVRAVKGGNQNLEDVIGQASTKSERLTADAVRETIDEETQKNERKNKQTPPGGGSGGGGRKGSGGSGSDDESKGGMLAGITGSLLNLDNLRRLITGLGQFTSTNNGFDLIKPAISEGSRIAGMAIGAALGSLVEPGGGTAVGAGLGGEIGGALGSAGGEFLQRRAFAAQNYLATRNRYLATTGGNPNEFGVGSMAEFGLSSTDMINLQRETARALGTSQNAERLTRDRFFADKGYGIDQSTSMSVIELFRTSQKESNKDLASLIGGVLQKGASTYFKNGDTTFLNELIGKMSSVQRELLKTQNEVGTATTYDILQRFNSVGGQFSTADPRSMGLISTINNALVSPQSDNMKAASFLALRRANPNMDVFDLLKEQQKGLGSSNYLSSVLTMVDQLGGDATQKKLNIANALGLRGDLAAAESIYQNQDKLRSGKISLGDLGIQTDLSGKAKAFTTPLEANTADISDKLLFKWDYTLSAMKDSFANAMQQVVDGINVVNQGGRLVLNYSSVQANKTRDAREASEKADSKRRGDMLMHLDH